MRLYKRSCSSVRPSVRPSVLPSVRPSVRSSVRPSIPNFLAVLGFKSHQLISYTMVQWVTMKESHLMYPCGACSSSLWQAKTKARAENTDWLLAAFLKFFKRVIPYKQNQWENKRITRSFSYVDGGRDEPSANEEGDHNMNGNHCFFFVFLFYFLFVVFFLLWNATRCLNDPLWTDAYRTFQFNDMCALYIDFRDSMMKKLCHRKLAAYRPRREDWINGEPYVFNVVNALYGNEKKTTKSCWKKKLPFV